jgi:predicted nucleic-acid-binding protein
VSHVVLVEVAWVLESVYGLERARIAAALQLLLEQEHLVVQEPETAAAALDNYRDGGGSDLADCMILELARRNGHLPLGTFDRKLAKLDGAERI